MKLLPFIDVSKPNCDLKKGDSKVLQYFHLLYH